MTEKCPSCGSCGMPLDRPDDHACGDVRIPFCRYCTDAAGELRPYDEILRMNADHFVRSQGVHETAAQRMAAELLAGMPAWRDHGTRGHAV